MGISVPKRIHIARSDEPDFGEESWLVSYEKCVSKWRYKLS